MMAEQPAKVSIANGLATGGVSLGFEGYDYTTGKPLTKENLLNSTNDILYTTGLATVTSNMPLGSTILSTTLGDKIYKGEGNFINNSKTISGSSILDNVFENHKISGNGKILLREIIIKGIEKSSKGEKNEK